MATADLEKRVEVLEKQVQELEDRGAIQTLRFRFHENVNEKRPELMGELFSSDAEIDYAHLGQVKGREKIIRFFQKGLSDLVPFVK
jgi:SnoaL-like protein